MIQQLAIIGAGLIGSSLALALREAGYVGEVIGFGRNRDNLERGVELGVLDKFGESLSATVEKADVVVVAVPLGAMASVFAEIDAVVKPGSVITDVGSAKGSVIAAANQNLKRSLHRFVPGHPIAGTENSGVEAGFSSLYQNRRVILTPASRTDADATALITQMWCQCGALVERLEVDHHDRVLAATSHLPHMLAFTLVHHLSGLNEHEEIFRFAAGGFRDFTRIASSDPVMWRDICLANGDMLIDLIEQYQKELGQLVDAVRLTDGNVLLQLFDKAKSERDSLMQAAHE